MPQPQRGWMGPAVAPEQPKSSAPTHRTRNAIVAILSVIVMLLLLSNHFIVVSSDHSFVILKKTSWTFDGCIIGEANWGLFALHHPLLVSRLIAGDGTWIVGSLVSRDSKPTTHSTSTITATTRPTTQHATATAARTGEPDHLNSAELSCLGGAFSVWNGSSETWKNVRLEVYPGGYMLRVKSIGAGTWYSDLSSSLVSEDGEILLPASLSWKGRRVIIRVFSSPWPGQSGAARSAYWDL